MKHVERSGKHSESLGTMPESKVNQNRFYRQKSIQSNLQNSKASAKLMKFMPK